MMTLTNEPALEISRTLAAWVGLNEAIFLQKLHNLLDQDDRTAMADGKKWIQRTLGELSTELPFWGQGEIKRIVRHLKQDGLITSRSDLSPGRTSWYAISHDVLGNLDGPVERRKRKFSKRRAARQTRQADHCPGFVYLCQEQGRADFKIGLARNVDSRMAQLKALLIHSIPTDDMLAAENGLHKAYRGKQVEGERFSLLSKDIEEIATIVGYYRGHFRFALQCHM
jgi:hypothetical protein